MKFSMENSDKKTSNSLKMVGSLVVVLLVVATVAWMANGNKPEASEMNNTENTNTENINTQNTETLPPQNTNTQNSNSLNTDTQASSYKDGSYTAVGSYVSPAGQEEVDVTLVLKDGKVASAEFVGKTQNPISKKLQTQFNEGYEQVVVGKSIDELSLTVVNGSSLTPKGFMDAVQKIKSQAKA